jgi:hypothetical protein
VVGIERGLGAADQTFNGHRYRFATWSGGGAASHAVVTPAASGTRNLTARAIDCIGTATTNTAIALTVSPAGDADTQAPVTTLTTPANLADGLTAPLCAYKHSATTPAGSTPGGFITGFAIAGGAVLPCKRPFPGALPRQLFLRRLFERFRRTYRPGQQQCRLCVRARLQFAR